MSTATRIAVSAILVTSALAAIHQNSAKLRRDGVLNLYPFPRVGRGSVRQTWELPNDLYMDYRPTHKRNLYAFPRVGRSEPSLHQLPFPLDQLFLEQFKTRPFSKRAIEVKSEKDPGMWFGPRLGRSLKEDVLKETDIPENEMNEVSDPEEVDQIEDDTRQNTQE